jgi:hypothetical protein
MVQQKTGVPVLARFPDVNGAESDGGDQQRKGLGLLASSGRLISQTASIKVLAGTALFLLVGAVLPFCIARNPSVGPSSADDPFLVGQTNSAGALPETVSGTGEAAALIASRPAVRVVAAKEPSAAPAVLPSSAEADGKLQASRSPEPALASPWPGAASSETQSAKNGSAASQPGVGPTDAVRQAEYEANVRTGAAPDTDRGTRR